MNIPYFNGSPRPMPVVLLRDKATGMMAYFANFHNPADTAQYHNQGKWRAEATRGRDRAAEPALDLAASRAS